MSIVRWGEDGSDVYLYESDDNEICCHGCSLAFTSAQECIDHLQHHTIIGDTVPLWVIQTILIRYQKSP
jgi:hypothetical protein